MQEIDQRDRELLNALQLDLPLVSTPFAVLGQAIDMSEKEVIKRAEKLKREGHLKQITATFDPRSLGYRSCLVAAKVDDERVDQAASVITLHPGVTQNYRRNHEFNLWFTLIVPPTSRLGLEKTVALLGEDAGCRVTRMLPTLRLFKNSSAHEDQPLDPGSEGVGGEEGRDPLSAQEIEYVKLLQRDLPLQPRPWDALAQLANLSGDEILGAAKEFVRRQQMRRFAGVIPSRKPGFSASVMGVWVVADVQAEQTAARMVTYPAVSHCYIRPTYSDWPYNLFTTVHGRSVDECESALHEIAGDLKLTQMKALYPTKEYKKTRIALFSPEIELWEAARQAEMPSSAVS